MAVSPSFTYWQPSQLLRMSTSTGTGNWYFPYSHQVTCTCYVHLLYTATGTYLLCEGAHTPNALLYGHPHALLVRATLTPIGRHLLYTTAIHTAPTLHPPTLATFYSTYLPPTLPVTSQHFHYMLYFLLLLLLLVAAPASCLDRAF